MLAGLVLPYPDGTLGWEISFLVVYSIIEAARLFEGAFSFASPSRSQGRCVLTPRCSLSRYFWTTGKKGNLSEQAAPMSMFLLFSILVACVHFYFFQWQVFVLKLDRLLNTICFVFVGLEVILVRQLASSSSPALLGC